jgi:hypothetical protein
MSEISSTKRCSMCGKEKPAEAFYATKQGRLSGRCRPCNSEYSKKWRKKNPKRTSEIAAKYLGTAKGKKNNRRGNKVFKERHPGKRKAHNAVAAAVRSGKLKQKPCEKPGCGHPDTEAHHPDYSKPLDVVWLCRAHHEEVHR